ncbi:MAG TPA: hypothetical protein DDW52_05315 [Planctomycetaceae bacterium]|nr:hypothetical protein [Planctomycetaceae bacterium]
MTPQDSPQQGPVDSTEKAGHEALEAQNASDLDQTQRSPAQEKPVSHAQIGQAPAIELSSVWPMNSPADADAALAGTSGAFVYRRDGHPNDRQLAEKLAMLHGGANAVLTAQGMSAIAAICLTELRPGAKACIADELYGRTQRLMHTDLTKWGVTVTEFSTSDASAVTQLAKGASLLVAETISNPCMQAADIAKLAQAAHTAGAKLVVDNTFATHALCRPLELGADYVVESLGKIVNGHADAMLGLAVAKSEDDANQLAATVSTFGMASSPLDCYLTHRGLVSLPVRIERSCQNAAALAQRLAQCANIDRVDYPGLQSDASVLLPNGSGWMLAAHLTADGPTAEELFERLSPEIPFVPSLGDVMTTLSHPASTSHRSLGPAGRQRLGISDRTIRISCGLEPTEWLLERFEAALA